MFLESGGLFSVVVLEKKTLQNVLENSMKVTLVKCGCLKKKEMIECRQDDMGLAKGFSIISQIKRTPSHSLQPKFALNGNCGESIL